MGRRGLRLVYTVPEAAELLGIGRSTAYEYVASGEIATVRIGSRLVVTRPALTQLLGVEPPLPAEMDAVRAALRTSAATSSSASKRPTPSCDASQERLPFTA